MAILEAPTLKDPRFVYLVVFIILLFSATYTVVMPLPTSKWVKEFYDVIESMPDGSRVYITSMVSAGNIADMSEGMVVALKHCVKKHFKVVYWDQDPSGPMFSERVLKEVYGDPVYKSPLYGKELVYLGYLPGMTVVYEAHKTDLWSYSSVDYYGNSVKDLPIANEIHNVKDDIDLIIGFDARALESAFVVPYGKTVIEVSVTMATAYLGASYAAGFFKGMIYGQRNAAEYELLLGEPGKGMSYAFSLTTLTIFMLIVIVVVNIHYFIRVRGKEAKK